MPFDPAWAPHIDHELAQLLLLHAEVNSDRFRHHPEYVRRAMRVAYAAHFRALMEFFRDGRKSGANGRDMLCKDFLGAPGPCSGQWGKDECDRFDEADKLVGHLSKRRTELGVDGREWGDPKDLELLRPCIVDFIKKCSSHKHLLPRTFGALSVVGLASE